MALGGKVGKTVSANEQTEADTILGAERLKALQDACPDGAIQYIRKMVKAALPREGGEELLYVICMTEEGSRRLLNAQYLQIDTSFKRIVGFYEFEVACVDRNANTSELSLHSSGLVFTQPFTLGVTFCRVFLNSQTATAHQTIMHELEDIVFEDTGKRLQWRHLHATSVNETSGMILQVTADQHSGQAKGKRLLRFYPVYEAYLLVRIGPLLPGHRAKAGGKTRPA